MSRRELATGSALGALTTVGAALAAYARIEPRLIRLEVKKVPLPGPRIEILHLSDTHLRSGKEHAAAFLRSLPDRLDRTPELILATGDMIETNDGIDPLLRLLEPLESKWGKFYVNGSHDLYQARFQSYSKYWSGRGPRDPIPADIDRLEAGYRELGWVALTNREEILDTEVGRIRLAGVDDPYLNRHDTSHLRTAPDDALAVGVMHAPDVVSEFALAGFDLMVAGHTHGGQVRFPLVGAVVTNCHLPTELAMGLDRVGSSWLHVSPGLGQGTFSPIRFLTRPEATLLRVGD